MKLNESDKYLCPYCEEKFRYKHTLDDHIFKHKLPKSHSKINKQMDIGPKCLSKKN